MFTNYDHEDEDEAIRRRRAAEPDDKPDPADVPYYGPGKPTREQLLAHWHGRALRAERELIMWRAMEQIRQRKKEQ